MEKGIPKTKVKNLNEKDATLDDKVAKLTILLEDLRHEKVGEYQTSVIIVRIGIENLKKKLVKLDDTIMNKLFKYVSTREMEKVQAELETCRKRLSQVKDGDQLELVNCEGHIAVLEARVKTLTARSNVFHESVYGFLHKAPKEKYVNMVDGTEHTVALIHIIIGILTCLFQIGIYIFIMWLLVFEHDQDSDDDMVGVSYDTLEGDLPTSPPTTTPPPTSASHHSQLLLDLTCFGAIGILFGNLLPDIMGLFILRIRWSAWAQFLIVTEIVCAFLTAFLLAVVQSSTKSILSLFLSIVGVIFVHTLDERVRLAMDTFEMQQKRSKIFVIAWISIVIIIFSSIAHKIDHMINRSQDAVRDFKNDTQLRH